MLLEAHIQHSELNQTHFFEKQSYKLYFQRKFF